MGRTLTPAEMMINRVPGFECCSLPQTQKTQGRREKQNEHAPTQIHHPGFLATPVAVDC